MSTDLQFFLLFLGPIFLVGVGLVFYGMRQRLRARASASWSSIQGKALIAAIKKTVSTSGKTHTRQTWYRPIIEYEYLVDGVRYQSNRIVFGNISSQDEEKAQSILDQAVKAGSVQVFYNPQNAKDAVLLNADAPGSMGFILGGVLIVVFPILLWVYFFVVRK